tara:strand:- start:799 stop:1320 length:522 start_codon:yes stop_codon:yes gene_type:complete
MIDIIKTDIEDIKIIQPKIYKDERGYFFESFNNKKFIKEFKNINFVQDNESKSKFGVLRGLHFQRSPYQQSKLVRVVEGEIQDVAVDMRKNSITYMKYVSVILNNQNKKQLFIPKGFAHGFLVLSKEAIVNYKVDNYYNSKYDSGLRYDDKKIGIKWLLQDNEIILSKKDKIL